MGQRVTGELPRGYLRLKARLHVGEIGRVSSDAAMSLAAFLDHVLPQTALKRATRVVERQAKVRENGRSSGWRSLGRLAVWELTTGGSGITTGGAACAAATTDA